jgi:catechol 2,3-dioxygenase-like lactoylglutathione lyase family enzyme
MNVQFIASVSMIVRDPPASRTLYVEALGLPLEASDGDDDAFSERIEGSKHFGLWPLRQAAESCFGTSDWSADATVPHVSVEFDVEEDRP